MHALVLASVLLLQGEHDEGGRLEQEAAARLETAPGEAVQLLRRAVVLRERAGDRADLARTLNSLAYALSLAGRHGEARTAGTRALDTARRGDEPTPLTAMVLRNLAEIVERGGDLPGARRHAEAALSDFEKTYGKTPMCAELREYCGRLALRQRDADAALTHLGWALAIHEKFLGPGDAERLAGPMHGVAEALVQLGRFGAALEVHDHALQLLGGAGLSGTPVWMAHTGGRLVLLERLGELDSAAQDFERWADAAALTTPAEQLPWAHLQWADRWLALGRIDRARGLLESVPVDGEHTEPRRRVRARVLLEGSEWQAALDTVAHSESALAAESEQGRPVVVELVLARARAQRGLGQHDESSEQLLELLRLERARWGEDTSRLFPTFLGLLESEVVAAKVTPELIDFLDFLDGSHRWMSPGQLASSQHRVWRRDGRSPWDAAVRGWLTLARARPKWLPESFAALDRLRERALLAAHAPWIESNSVGREPDVGALLDVLRREPGVEKNGREVLLAEYEAVVTRLRERRSRWVASVAPSGASVEEVRARLSKSGETLLCLSWTAESVTALLVAPEGDVQVVDLGPAEPLSELLREARAALGDPERRVDLTALGEKLLAPLWPHLSACRSVVAVVDGPLAFLPLEALPTPRGQPWVRNCRVVYASTVGRWLRAQALRRDSRRVAHLQGGAGSNGGQLRFLRARLGLEPVRTASDVSRQIPADDLVLASEPALRHASDKGELRGLRLLEVSAPTYVDAVVPSATGLVPGATGQADLALWERDDGHVSLGELRGLDLDVDTAVLWTASVVARSDRDLRSEGLHDLVAALHGAGVRSVVLSGWRAAHDASFQFDMQLRHELGGEDPQAALIRAQRRWLLRAERAPHLADPGIWARLRQFGR